MNHKDLRQTLQLLKKGELTREAAATALDCSTRHVNRLMRTYSVTRPAAQAREVGRRAEHTERLTALALKVVDGGLDPEKEASKAKISARTLYRWMAKVKNQGITSKNKVK